MTFDRLTPLLRVTLTHEYYAGDFTQFAAVPLPRTVGACRRLGLSLLRDGNELTLFSACDPRRVQAVAALAASLAQTTLCWEIRPASADFAAFTDLDFVGSCSRVLLTTNSAHAIGGNLTVGRQVSIRDLYPWHPLAFDFRPTAPVPARAIVVLENGAGEILRAWPVSDPALISVDVSDLGSGFYRLRLEREILHSWFADERGSVGAGSDPSAMLVLPGTLLAAVFGKAMRGSGAAPPTYAAEYPARPVTWRYHFFNVPPEESLRIEPLDANVPVPEAPAAAAAEEVAASVPRSRPEFIPVASPDFPTASSFQAVAPFKLAAQPPQRFALFGGSTIRLAPLPVAGLPLAAGPEEAALCSDIFVYL